MIYFDNAATTRGKKSILDAMERAFLLNFGNPSSLYSLGIDAENEIKSSIEAFKAAISAKDGTVVFTGSGTEANNLAVRGALYARRRSFDGFSFDAAEHESVVVTGKKLAEEGFSVIAVPPTGDGRGDIGAIVDSVNEKTGLVSMMLVNNEVGSITDIAAASRAIKRKNPNTLIHCDAVAAFCKEEIKVNALGVDLLTVSGHKIHAPKGIGALWIKKGVRILPVLSGSSQQGGLRPGTEPVPLIAAFREAAIEASEGYSQNRKNAEEINAYLRRELSAIPGIEINSPPDACSNILNFSTLAVKSEIMLHFLESRGIFVSSGSACNKGAPSHVLSGMGLRRENIAASLRLSFSDENTLSEAEQFVSALKDGLSTLLKSF